MVIAGAAERSLSQQALKAGNFTADGVDNPPVLYLPEREKYIFMLSGILLSLTLIQLTN
jgi:hypothetical protein